MLDTPFEQISSLIVVLACGFGLWLGGRPERIGAGAMLAAWAASVLVQNRTDWTAPQYGFLTVDAILLGVLAVLALRTRRRWPTFAAAFQLLMVGAHVAMILDLSIRSVALITTVAIWSLAVLIALVAGVVFEALPERRAGARARGATG